MLRKLWNMLGRHTLCGAALLTAANLVHGQASLPSLPEPSVVPAVTRDAPRNEPIIRFVAQEPATPQSLGLGVPASTPAALPGTPVAPANTDDKARIERLEKQVQDLTSLLKTMQSRSIQAPVSNDAPQGSLTTKDVQQLINGYFAEKE